MKNLFISVLVFIITTVIVLASDETFYTALQNCSAYNESGQITVDGTNVQFRNNILGWDNGKCTYKEYVSYSGMNSCTTCKFSQKQINELVNVMRAYSTVQRYSLEKIDTSSLSGTQNNPVVRVWNKYLQDSSVCTIELPN